MIFCGITSLVPILAPPAFNCESDGSECIECANSRGEMSTLLILINPFVFLVNQPKLNVIHSLINTLKFNGFAEISAALRANNMCLHLAHVWEIPLQKSSLRDSRLRGFWIFNFNARSFAHNWTRCSCILTAGCRCLITPDGYDEQLLNYFESKDRK